MSSTASTRSKRLAISQPEWLWPLLGASAAREGDSFAVDELRYRIVRGVPRAETLMSETQGATRDSFSYIWSAEDRFQSESSLVSMREWYRENYGSVADASWWDELGQNPLVIEAGCGAGISGSETFGQRINRVRYLAVDVSDAVDQAAARFARLGLAASFLQADLMKLPIPDGAADLIYSQGVLHHTDSTEFAIGALARKLRSGGRFLFYVYRRKGPVREFSDDYIRDRLQALEPPAQWDAMMPLTKLGHALGGLNVLVDVPEAVDLLGIPAGKIDLQRLFYWHVAKAFHRPEYTLDEMNHVNLDWYSPINAHRQSIEDVRSWCEKFGLQIEREHVQEAGISIVAIKK